MADYNKHDSTLLEITKAVLMNAKISSLRQGVKWENGNLQSIFAGV
jgi:hypothetical protein